MALIGTLPVLAALTAGGTAVANQAVVSLVVLTAFLTAPATSRTRGRLGRRARAAVSRAVTVVWRL
ncbi:hypothetical protein [Micromonospora sp. NPDC005203]|uniref:hypothetical protein n=1 Tax=Micromonospora sp. NPDC005203 TaxID=3364226 RepID=UPI00369C5EC9